MCDKYLCSGSIVTEAAFPYYPFCDDGVASLVKMYNKLAVVKGSVLHVVLMIRLIMA